MPKGYCIKKGRRLNFIYQEKVLKSYASCLMMHLTLIMILGPRAGED